MLENSGGSEDYSEFNIGNTVGSLECIQAAYQLELVVSRDGWHPWQFPNPRFSGNSRGEGGEARNPHWEEVPQDSETSVSRFWIIWPQTAAFFEILRYYCQ